MLLFITDLFADFTIVLKIFVLLTIASFFLQNLGKTPISIILIVGVSYFVLFDLWIVFGSIYVVWMLLMFGMSSIIIDFFFTGAFGHREQEAQGGGPISNGKDLAQRQAALQAAQQQAIGNAMGRFGG